MRNIISRSHIGVFVLVCAFVILLPIVQGFTGIIAQGQESDTPFCGMQYVEGDDLATVESLGVNVVLQTFRHDRDPAEWLAQLDLAQSHGLRVIGRLWPEGWEWDGAAWQIDDQARSFVQTVAVHPATFAVYALHEPYWRGCYTCGLTTAQQQALYKGLKAVADVPLYSEIGDITFWINRSSASTISDGVCDYCASFYYPFFADGEYRRDEFISHLDKDLAAIREFAPNSKLVWLLQVFAQSNSPNPRRMPTAREIADIGAIVGEGDVDGIFWYVWAFGHLYDDTLSNHRELLPAVASMQFCANTPATATSTPAHAGFLATATPRTPIAVTTISLSPTSTLSTDTATPTPIPSPASTDKIPQNPVDNRTNLCGLAGLLGLAPLGGCVTLILLIRMSDGTKKSVLLNH